MNAYQDLRRSISLLDSSEKNKVSVVSSISNSSQCYKMHKGTKSCNRWRLLLTSTFPPQWSHHSGIPRSLLLAPSYPIYFNVKWILRFPCISLSALNRVVYNVESDRILLFLSNLRMFILHSQIYNIHFFCISFQHKRKEYPAKLN